eukprot:scaffold83642_cov18-Tisochrysis_lutea.AAC.2
MEYCYTSAGSSLSNSTGAEPVHVFPDSHIYCNSPLLQEAFHADVSLSSINTSRWASHLLFTTNGLHYAHGFQQKI